MKVEVIPIRTSCAIMFRLCNANNKKILIYTPNFRTPHGALNWAKKHGYEIA